MLKQICIDALQMMNDIFLSPPPNTPNTQIINY